MTRVVSAGQVTVDGEQTIEARASDVKLSERDLTTIKNVYAAKERLDSIRQKRLDKEQACFELCNEAARQISAGDSGQAIIFLREVLNLDSSFKVALQNLMAAYYNCGVELYNKQRYAEALPVLNRSLELGKRVGSVTEQNEMRSVQHNCLLAIERAKQTPQSTPAGSQSSYSGRSLERGR